MSAIIESARPEIEFVAKVKPIFDPYRYKTLYGGRGGLKSWTVARAFLLLGTKQTERFLCAREVQKSIKDSVHKLLSDQIEELGMGDFYDILETEIRGKNGTEFLFAGLSGHTVTSIKSFEGITKVWVEEANTVTKRSWDVLTPTIRAEGSEIWITFNPELDTDETYVRFVLNPPPDSFVCELTYLDNPWFPKVLEDERRHCELTQPEEDYRNIWLGQCRSAVVGAIYAKEVAAMVKEGRICRVPYDPMLKVHTVWDLGLDTTSIGLVQSSRSEIRIIDFIEDVQLKLDHYAGELQKRNYNWGYDWLPHDGHADNIKSPSAAKILRAFGRKVKPKVGTKYPVPNLGIEQGIRATRSLFPRLVIDREKGAALVEHWKRYRRHKSEATQTFGDPIHDEHSHGCDMTRYLALVADQLTNEDDGNPRGEPVQKPFSPWDSGTGAL